MLAKDMYSRVKGIMSEKGSSKVFDDYFFPALNTILGETFNDNNMCRMFNDKKPLTKIPQHYSFDDELTYETEYLINVIPYGIAAQLETDDDLTKNGIFATKYSNAKVMAQKVLSADRVRKIMERED